MHGMHRRKKLLELMRNGRQAVTAKTSYLIKVLQSEITRELSIPRFQNDQSGSPGDFTLEWDAPHSKDIVLRKKCETGEELAVSALLGSAYSLSGTYPWNVEMKVCVKKPGLASLLQFDCNVYMRNDSTSEYYCHITSARYLQSSSSTGPRYYTGPSFRDLDPDLRTAFDEYLKTRLGGSLLKFLIEYMHRKEQNQYVNWLQKLQEMVCNGESSSPS